MGKPVRKPILSSQLGLLRALGAVVLPSPEALDEEGWKQAEAIIEEALASRPPRVRRQLRIFLWLVNLLPLLRTGHTFERLSLEKRAVFLGRLQRSPVTPLRRGLWGVRTLLFMGYYNLASVRARIGYAADPRGWGARAEDSPLHPSDGKGGEVTP